MTPDATPPADPGGRAQLYTLALAAFVVAGGMVAGTTLRPSPTPAAPPDLKAAAVADLRRDKPAPLSGPLAARIADARPVLVPTQPHPLAGRPAPEFALADVDGATVRLSELTARGPVVLVFYLGYSCNHCVSQLFGLNEDLSYLRELGASVVAASRDPAAPTPQR